jgi:hypothetical protein
MSSGNNLRYVPEKHKTYEMCLESAKHGTCCIEYVPEEHITYELCLEFVKGGYIDGVPEEHLTYELCCEYTWAAIIDTHPIEFVADEYKTYEVYLHIAQNEGLYHVPYESITYEMCLEAVKNYSGDYDPDDIPDEHITYELFKEAEKTEYYLENAPEIFKWYMKLEPLIIPFQRRLKSIIWDPEKDGIMCKRQLKDIESLKKEI